MKTTIQGVRVDAAGKKAERDVAVDDNGQLMGRDGQLTPLGCFALPNLASAKGLLDATGMTQAILDQAKLVLVAVETAAVRYKDDGVVPTAAEGIPLAAAEKFPYNGNLAAIKFIQQAAGATISFALYK
jgi:hypothetical protein